MCGLKWQEILKDKVQRDPLVNRGSDPLTDPNILKTRFPQLKGVATVGNELFFQWGQSGADSDARAPRATSQAQSFREFAE